MGNVCSGMCGNQPKDIGNSPPVQDNQNKYKVNNPPIHKSGGPDNNQGGKQAPSNNPPSLNSDSKNPQSDPKLLNSSHDLKGKEEDKEKKKLTIADFQWIQKLGKGAFGEVFLVEKKNDTKKTKYAMKILNKTDIHKRQLMVHTKIEQTVLKNNKHPFLVELKYSFQTEGKIYFLMEFLEGGDLFKSLQQVKKFDNTCAQFIFAQVVEGIKHMHEDLKIKYRDLKPENIMLTKEHYIKIIDFGLSRLFENPTDATMTMVGTPEYLAPEIVLKKGHTKDVDLWGLGIFLYELLEGKPPFTDPKRNFEKISKSIVSNRPSFPAHFHPNATDIIRKLLKSEPQERLGSKDFNDLINHPFFEGIDWQKLKARQIESPLTPVLNRADVNNKILVREPRPFYETPLNPNQEKMYIQGITYNYDGLNQAANN